MLTGAAPFSPRAMNRLLNGWGQTAGDTAPGWRSITSLQKMLTRGETFGDTPPTGGDAEVPEWLALMVCPQKVKRSRCLYDLAFRNR